MTSSVYVGIYFKQKSGGLICIYNPEVVPRFWYFKSNDDISFITRNIIKLIDNKYSKIVIHTNQSTPKDLKQIIIYNKIIGMIAGLSIGRIVKFKIVKMKKVTTRIQNLLNIKQKSHFKLKLIDKKMHENRYNDVYIMTHLQSKQSINTHRNAYLLAYYGYLKNKINLYNNINKEFIDGKQKDNEKDNEKERTEIRLDENDGPS